MLAVEKQIHNFYFILRGIIVPLLVEEKRFDAAKALGGNGFRATCIERRHVPFAWGAGAACMLIPSVAAATLLAEQLQLAWGCVQGRVTRLRFSCLGGAEGEGASWAGGM